MRKAFLAIVAVAMIGSLTFASGCAKKAASASDAIEHAKTLKTPQEQANYLIGQANAFLGSKQYKDAISSAQYVLSSVDSNSQKARDLLDKAKAQLSSEAQKAVGDTKKKLGF